MKILCFASLIVPLLLSSFEFVSAQNAKEKASLDNTEQFTIASKYVQGETYLIQIGLPFGYKSSTQSYPVLYVLDGDYSFGMAKNVTDMLILGKEIKDIIVVGIGYGQGIQSWMSKRARDLTPDIDTSSAVRGWFPEYGGAENFIKFFQNELMPHISKDYRTIRDSSIIFGVSFGGLACSYILFKQPELFKDYIIVEPSLWWNNKTILKQEANYAKSHKDLPCNVYIANGAGGGDSHTESMIKPAKELIQNLQTHNYQGLKIDTRVFEGETHTSVYSTALVNGLKILLHISN